MGIPLYYKNLIQNYPEIIIPNKDLQIKPNNLFLDLNCAIHPCCANKTDENEMYESILEKIKECIQITKVKDLIYIAIDGPAPRTKMEQQRQRRLKSLQDKKIWDTNQITPGTKFMNNLNIFLKKNCKSFNIKWILSDSNEPGEGEHKIMKYIDTLHKNDINIVYGLDADLIMLSMIRKHKIYLLRERTEYNIENLDTDYIYCDIHLLKKYLIETIKKPYFKISNESILNDYLFICFFIGNDFIINTPCINIRYNGLDNLINTYNELQGEYFGNFYLLNEERKIDSNNFKLFLQKLASKETRFYHEIMKIRRNQELKYKKIYNEILQSKKFNPSEIQNYTNEDFNTSEDFYKGFKNHLPIILRNNEKEILKNYYPYHFYNTLYPNPSHKQLTEINKKKLCQEYIKSIQWTLDYYFHQCNNWKWYYQYHFAPLLVDLVDYSNSINERMEEDKEPHTPEEQLKIVLPCQENTYYYPKQTPLYSFMKRYYWECHPILPH